ncbi:hypothetical protein KUV44_07195 [Marinobacter daepoensis]|uniref:Uncharacterized protein n=2 Tax=Marinobacter daepoensis TaxID=262077 RepID=A0ABS3BI79_9GAMM|nr:hypothetical protein [Marinobacter daepoensis]MBY6078917.1 hypothetical protein [Marinobacter daepoensis]
MSNPMATDNDEHQPPGTAAPARTRKAACGIRFDEDELQEGIDFSAAADLKPGKEKPQGKPGDPNPSATHKDR